MATEPLSFDSFLSRHSLEKLGEQLHQDKAHKYSLGIKLLAFAGALVGACMFLVFLFIADVIRSGQSLFTLGLVFWGVSLAMSYTKETKGLMYEPSLLVLNIFGKLLILFSETIFDYEHRTLGYFILFLAIEGITLIISKNLITRFFAAVLLPCLLVGTFWKLEIYESIHFVVGFTAWLCAWLWSEESFILSKYPRNISYFYPLGFGLAIALIIVLSTNVYREFSDTYFKHWWISSVLIWALLWQQVRYIVKLLQIPSKWHILIYLALILLLSPTIFTPGVSFSLLIIVVGFRVGNVWLSTLGIIALFFFVNAFYYNLNLSLLLKSITLMIAGVLFIGLFFVIKKWKTS